MQKLRLAKNRSPARIFASFAARSTDLPGLELLGSPTGETYAGQAHAAPPCIALPASASLWSQASWTGLWQGGGWRAWCTLDWDAWKAHFSLSSTPTLRLQPEVELKYHCISSGPQDPERSMLTRFVGYSTGSWLRAESGDIGFEPRRTGTTKHGLSFARRALLAACAARPQQHIPRMSRGRRRDVSLK